MIYEKATVSGHPNLLPNVLSSGHFSGNKIIQVLTGFRKCDEKDLRDPEIGILCRFFGVLPVIKTYETVLVTAMIMPGSSGSGIYNSNMELSSLVFAGSRNMGYAFSVPYEFIGNFLRKELPTSEKIYPNYTFSPTSKKARDTKVNNVVRNVRKSCEKTSDMRLKKVCSVIERDIDWRQNETSFTFDFNPKSSSPSK